ncbi:MAG TPA: CoA-binding protein [Candidatus Nanoarchaeia archaeon]|nr:CoA-binding protein [Candidatus Nanoarchaeia archaeon]
MKRGLEGLNKLLNPKTIAVVGASETPGKVGNVLMRKLEKSKCLVIPINPNRTEVLGKKSYSSVDKYPNKIGLVIIATPAPTVKSILEQCGKKKIKNVIIISAGFSEIGNQKEEYQIIKTAGKFKINFLGPNCFGIANPFLDLDATFSNNSAKKGSIAFISQSGALWSYIADLDIKQGFSAFISLGNMAGLSFSDFIEYLNKDKKTKKIILYIEKLKNGREFINACKKSKKEIIVVKAGQTEAGSKAAISHTGSLATEYEVYKGIFRQANIKFVNSLAEAFNLKMPKIQIEKEIKTALIITNAGGAGALLTDYIGKRGIKVKIIDLLGTALAKDYKKTLDKKINKKYGKIIVILTPQAMSHPEETSKIITKSKYKKKIITLFLGDKSVSHAIKILRKSGIKVYDRI